MWPTGHHNRIRGVAVEHCYNANLLVIQNTKQEWMPVNDLLAMKTNDIAPILKANLTTKDYNNFVLIAYKIDLSWDNQKPQAETVNLS